MERNKCTISKNNKTIGLSVLYAKKKKINHAYVSTNNLNCEKQVRLVMIPNGKGWHYLSVKKLPALLEEQSQNIKAIFIV